MFHGPGSGTGQTLIAELSDLTRSRISQIAQATELPAESLEAFGHRVYQVIEWPQDHLRAIAEKRSPEAIETRARKDELIHGASTGTSSAPTP